MRRVIYVEIKGKGREKRLGQMEKPFPHSRVNVPKKKKKAATGPRRNFPMFGYDSSRLLAINGKRVTLY